jgi:hypothetical protein
MAQAIRCLSSKPEALSSNPRATKTNFKKRKISILVFIEIKNFLFINDYQDENMVFRLGVSGSHLQSHLLRRQRSVELQFKVNPGK